jgi:mannose-6-phosphate isomerase-like protein (cupin superfamily)
MAPEGGNMTGYTANIEEITQQNTNFRQVLYTGTYAQLVAMSLLKDEEIGMEVHKTVDQFFRIESGTAKIIMNGEETTLTDGMVAVVPAGVEHNLINVGPGSLKLYTIYSPPNHPVGTIHKTKAEAMAAE